MVGSSKVRITTATVARTRLREGRLAVSGRWVRTTSTIEAADTTDSMNQPVRNSAGLLRSTQSSTAKVRTSNSELTRPKVSMKRLMKAMSQRWGCSIQSASTRSPAIVISGRSVSRLVSRICFGSSGRNGSSKEAPAIEIMLPKLALVAMNTYLSVLAKVRRPSRMPALSTARSFSSSTISAASLATSTAPCTDRLTSAACSAGASLMPSPM